MIKPTGGSAHALIVLRSRIAQAHTIDHILMRRTDVTGALVTTSET